MKSVSLQQVAEGLAANREPESDLGQLPGHHPLINDGISDEGQQQHKRDASTSYLRLTQHECCRALLFSLQLSFHADVFVNFADVIFCASEAPQETLPVEEGGLEGESWAKPLAHLWQSRPPNLKKEREYNQRMCSRPPYCSICMLFHTYQQVICSGTHSTHQLLQFIYRVYQHIDHALWSAAGVMQEKQVSLKLKFQSEEKNISEQDMTELHISVCCGCCQTESAKSIDGPVLVAGGRMRTKPLIPEMCFTTTTEEDSECEEQPVTPHLEEDGTSLLISCSQCSVRVHTSQYIHS